ncbi:MAG: hypothetical protein KY445_13845 [Armatimonadetes bacterium]|nr:hypothetical protein [Armatimonadota bacterium]
MPKIDAEDELPPDIAAAFDQYQTPPLSRDFEAKFWAQFEARRGRYRGFAGFLRRLWEIEIEGVAVWRLAASTFSGGAACALFLGCFALFAMPAETPRVLPLPTTPVPETPRMAFDARAFYAREWEEFGLTPPPKIAPTKRQKLENGGEISCVGSENGWV